MKKFEANGRIEEIPLNLDLVNENGEMNEFYLINGDVKEKITLADIVNNQVEIVKKYNKDNGNGSQLSSSEDYSQLSSSEDYSQLSSSGNFSRLASNGDVSRLASSGNYSKLISSENGSKLASSGSNSQLASSGYDSQLASSGYYSQLASSGNYSRLASSGNDSQLASSGNGSKLASSGNYSQLASSGNGSKLASSGNYSQLASSGYGSQLASSGYDSRLASSGNYSKLSNSGDVSRLVSSGDSSKLSNSGDDSQLKVNGENSIAFACGIDNIIKAKKGTWISLAEFDRDVGGMLIPVFAKSAQIGNNDYLDNNGNELSEEFYYCLHKKEFHEMDLSDGIKTIVLEKKEKDGIKVVKGVDYNGDEVYIYSNGVINAHGYSKKEAKDSFKFKMTEFEDKKEIIEEIKETRVVNRMQYRKLTGACEFGVKKFCKRNGIGEDEETVDLEKVLKMLNDDDYGAKDFKKFFE